VHTSLPLSCVVETNELAAMKPGSTPLELTPGEFILYGVVSIELEAMLEP
jgi:hypothetical protein